MLLFYLISICTFLVFIINISLYKELFDLLDLYMGRIRNFLVKNESIFDISFLLIFFMEQIGLVIFVFLCSERTEILKLGIAIFALIVVTTASFQKLLSDVKLKYLKEDKSRTIAINEYILEDVNSLIEENEELIEKIESLKNKLKEK